MFYNWIYLREFFVYRNLLKLFTSPPLNIRTMVLFLFLFFLITTIPAYRYAISLTRDEPDFGLLIQESDLCKFKNLLST